MNFISEQIPNSSPKKLGFTKKMNVSDVFKIMNRENIFIVGISGGIASGKTTVANEFAKLGAYIINADKIVHQILQQKNTQNQIQQIFPEVFVEGVFQKQNLAKEVFSCPEKIKKLENMLHPLVRVEIKTQLENLAKDDRKIVLLDAALLWENGLSEGVDKLVFVDTSISLRRKRAQENRNWSTEELDTRERFQLDLAVKKQGSHYIINNDDESVMKQQVQATWNVFPQ